MTTMGDDGERYCPLCAEEMDLTDQQLKPCRCGYEICVWCWHHIIEMAEKDDSEARCPACRTAYDKERIVGTAAKCEKVVAEVNAERKQKPKAKPKAPSDARKHLNSVRVIQRNLVYVVGLPSNMADENLLERREYFGQYGRVLKVSISRTSGGSQPASNINAFSVYITYAKEEEAVRCIQAVHNFVLEGKPLRACFGTTKYCRAWLRNMACNNPDCLYLHDVGCQEDSFTKDEVISAYTRNRVPPVSSASGSAQRRIGSVLPPPADELLSSVTVSNSKTVIKTANAKSSPLDIGGSGKPAGGLPAAASWGLRANFQASLAQRIPKDKSQSLLSTSVPPSSGASLSSWHDNALPAVTGIIEEQCQRTNLNGKDSLISRTVPSMDIPNGQCSSAWSDDDLPPGSSPDKHSTALINGELDSLPEISASKGSSSWYNDASVSRDISAEAQVDGSKIFNNELSQAVDSNLPSERSSWDDDVGSAVILAPDDNHAGEIPDDFSSSKANSTLIASKESNKEGLLSSPHPLFDRLNESLSFTRAVGSCAEFNGNIQNLSSQLSSHNLNEHDSVSNVLDNFKRSEGWQQLCTENGVGNHHTPEYSDASRNHLLGTLSNDDYRTLGTELRKGTYLSNGPEEGNNFMEYPRYPGRLHTKPLGQNAYLDRGESNIISNILSMDFDPWSTSVSAGSFAKFLGKSDEQNDGLKMTSLWKGQSNESRFSFARQETQQPFSRTPLCEVSQMPRSSSAGIQNGFMPANSRYSALFNGNQVTNLFEKSSAPKAKTSAPPGFSVPSRFQTPPPGFSYQEKLDRAYDSSYSDNHMFGGPSPMKDHKVSSAGYSGDVEFFDPAILAVGKGRVQQGIDYSGVDSRYSPDVDPRLQLLMQQPLSHQEPRIPDNYGARFSSVSDPYVSSRHQNFHQNHASMSSFGMMTSQQQQRNTQWDSWNGSQDNAGPVLSEAVRNKGLGLNRFFSGNEETFRSGFNRDYGI